MSSRFLSILFLLFIFLFSNSPEAISAEKESSVLRQENLVAWCIVPFDAKQRTPEQRAKMLKDLGIHRAAYDWREEHIPTFEEEILAYQKNEIEFFAFWNVHEEAFKLFEKYHLHPQIWQTLRDPQQATQAENVEVAAKRLRPIAERTQAMNCKYGLYNHGGWGGEPENLVAVCEKLRSWGYDHVGIVYNFHHAHEHLENWSEKFALMQPYLHCLNLNGMNSTGSPKILGIGKGQDELEMIQTILNSGYDGPIGILDHRNELDARESLLENIEGLKHVRKQLEKTHSMPDQETSQHRHAAHSGEMMAAADNTPVGKYSAARVSEILAAAKAEGDVFRGAKVFATPKLACVSCHKISTHGGAVGPELTKIAKDRTPQEIVTSLYWPDREVKPEYVVWQILTSEGQLLSGFKQETEDNHVQIRDPSSGKVTTISQDEVEAEIAGTTIMPVELTASMSRQQRLDLIQFLLALGQSDSQQMAKIDRVLTNAMKHGPTDFPWEYGPLVPANWPHAGHPVNRQRVYDFYTKQAEYFRNEELLPMLLTPYPGLDGPDTGHWGNQSEEDWADQRWNEMDLGNLQAGIFHGKNGTVPRGVCVRLGDHGEVSACYNPEALTYPEIWQDTFLSFSGVRHGFLSGLRHQGKLIKQPPSDSPTEPFQYLGFYRFGNRVAFACEINGIPYLDAPWVENGKFTREFAPLEEHSLKDVVHGGPSQWPQTFETEIIPGEGHPYALDTIELPFENPWNSLLFLGGHDFLSDGSAMVCTIQGDVWHVTGLDSGTDEKGKATWRRFAAGLNLALGLVIHNDEIYVLGRDQITKLRDLNGDGEADFYECFSNAFETSPAGHDFICGLERDSEGNFYIASGNQGVVRISADGKEAKVLATGFRNPDGLGLLPDGTVTVPCSEGSWTPSSMICAVPSEKEQQQNATDHPPHFGYQGPRNGEVPYLPLAYLPRGMDNSSGGQTYISSDAWGPFQGKLAHLSFGMGASFIVLQDEVEGQVQGAVLPLAGDFLSGAHRGRFRPQDGQLYVSGMAGWGAYITEDGCFQRVRYSGDSFQAPTGFHVHENGIHLTFAEPVDPSIAEEVKNHFAQCWNYRYSGSYGSPEYSPSHPGVQGHDPLEIASAHVLSDERSLFLEIPDLQPVNVLHLRLNVNERSVPTPSPAGKGHDLFVTVHKLDAPFTDFEGYHPTEKIIAAHPMLSDLALNEKREPNPFEKRIKTGRPIEIETGKNLTYLTTEIRVKAGEPIAFTLANPDVVPHNWVLVKQNALQSVGELANQLIAHPDAFARQYIPESKEILAYTDIVPPGEKKLIYFYAPEVPGRYPYLCSFPGHWMVMNGTLIVE
ncbi:Auracyanin-A [Planctomycetales bacterium 10988]|nr:Auracyanin-A [Planctomycetales bacterium 10988]